MVCGRRTALCFQTARFQRCVQSIVVSKSEPLITCRQNHRHRCQSLNSGAHMLEYLAVVVNGSFGPLHSCWMYCHCSFVHWPTYLAATKLICGEIFHESIRMPVFTKSQHKPDLNFASVAYAMGRPIEAP